MMIPTSSSCFAALGARSRTCALFFSCAFAGGMPNEKAPRARGLFSPVFSLTSHGNGLAFLDRCFRHGRWRRRCGLTLLLLLRFGGLALLSREVCSAQLP